MTTSEKIKGRLEDITATMQSRGDGLIPFNSIVEALKIACEKLDSIGACGGSIGFGARMKLAEIAEKLGVKL